MDNFAETLWHEFVVETEEHLQAVEPLLAGARPHQTAPADIAQLFRSFHSIKGLARAMDMLGMEGVAHHAENLLGLVRDRRAALTPAVTDLLLQSVDALKRMRDVVAETRHDVAPDPELVARLAATFAEAGGAGGNAPPTAASPAAADGAALHDDPEMLAIFVEMVKARGPELCGALGATGDEREVAVDAAETLTHAAEVMNFDALSAGFGGLRDALQTVSSAEGLDEPIRQDLVSRLGDIRLQIELVGEVTGRDSGVEAFSAALAERIGDERHRLALSIAAVNRRLRDDMADGDRLAAEADGAAIARLARTLHGMAAALSLTHIAAIALLIEDIYGRIASGDLDASETLIDAADEVFSQIVDKAKSGGIEDFTDREAARFAEWLRTPLTSTAGRASPAANGSGGDGDTETEDLVAGLSLPPELLAILSTDNLAELERGITRDGLLPYEILMHLEADPERAGRLIAWLTGEVRPITNRTVVTDGESWFEFLALSALDPAALTAALLAIDPDRRCVKRVRRLTATPGGEPVLGQPPAIAAVADAAAPARPSAAANLIRVRGETLDGFLDELGEMRVLIGTLTHLIRGAGSREIAARARTFAERLPRDLRSEFLAMLEDFRERDRRLLQSEEQISGRLSRLHQS
ncbi:MAG TPA: Hpt domain-containing protein, partial [Stellaceae bacterium]|nr:Hpt domain-containing protein [Stellaceae bacterium]